MGKKTHIQENKSNKAEVAIALTQRMSREKGEKAIDAYYQDYKIWSENNHTQLGFQMNLTTPCIDAPTDTDHENGSHMDLQWWSSGVSFRLHFPYVSTRLNTKLFFKALRHTYGFKGERYVGYAFGEPAPNVPFSFGPMKLPRVFGMMPMPWMMPMPMKAEFRKGAAGFIKSSVSKVAQPYAIIFQELICAVGAKQEEYFVEFQKAADDFYKNNEGIYAFYCTKTNTKLPLTDKEKKKAGHHLEKLVNVYVFESKVDFEHALPVIKKLTGMTDGAYRAIGKYSKVAVQSQIWSESEVVSGEIKAALGDCDYWTLPKGKKSGFTDFKNADGGLGC